MRGAIGGGAGEYTGATPPGSMGLSGGIMPAGPA